MAKSVVLTSNFFSISTYSTGQIFLWKASGENVVNEDELSQFSRSVNDLFFLSSAAALCIGSFLQVLEFGLNIVIGFFGLKLSIVGFVMPVIVLVCIANAFHNH